MRDRFSELIKNGVASFTERPVAKNVPETDVMVRLYNNLWGALTDTHMSTVEDGYIITGTFTQTPAWNTLKYSWSWGSTNIKLGSGYNSLEEMVNAFEYIMKPDVYNGDNVIKLVKKTESNDPNAVNQVGDCGCCPCCGDACYTSESKIPHSIREILSEKQIEELKDAWRNANGNAYKIIENLKSSKHINTNNVRLTSDNEYLLVNEQYKIKLR